jgi:hypothetical protein
LSNRSPVESNEAQCKKVIRIIGSHSGPRRRLEFAKPGAEQIEYQCSVKELVGLAQHCARDLTRITLLLRSCTWRPDRSNNIVPNVSKIARALRHCDFQIRESHGGPSNKLESALLRGIFWLTILECFGEGACKPILAGVSRPSLVVLSGKIVCLDRGQYIEN